MKAIEAALQLNVHKPGDGKVEVTSASHPMLFEAFEIVSHDSGWAAGHASYWIPVRWAEELERIDRTMAALLGVAKLVEFCIGDQDETLEFIASHPVLARAHALLNEFFEDFDIEGLGEAAP